MLNICTTNRSVNLPKPDASGLSQRVTLTATAQLGPLNFFIHRPLDRPDGFVISEYTTRAALVFDEDLSEAVTQLRLKLQSESIYSIFEQLEKLNDYEKQSTIRLQRVPAA